MVAMQAFIDDSCIGQSPLYCLAGVVAPASYWPGFSQRWQAVLGTPPSIPYWKTSNAMTKKGPIFDPLSADDRNVKLRNLVGLINQLPIIKFAVTTRHVDYCEVFGRKKISFNAWGLLSTVITQSIASFLDGFQSTAGIGELESLDIIFDSQPEQMEEVAAGWKRYYEDAPDWYKRFLAKPPIFRDEKEFIPIQAADLLAWYVRRRILVNNGMAAPATDMPPFDHLTLVHVNLTRDELYSIRDYAIGTEIGRVVGNHWFGDDREKY